MTFHEGLILLFTSAYDHSICVWNPYIQSLIHKVVSNINCLQIDIIPDTNFLIALDAASNVKIREVNKFTMVSQFTVNPAVSTWCVCMYCMCAMLCRRLNVYEL